MLHPNTANRAKFYRCRPNDVRKSVTKIVLRQSKLNIPHTTVWWNKYTQKLTNVNLNLNQQLTVKPRLYNTTCCQTGCQTGLTTG